MHMNAVGELGLGAGIFNGMGVLGEDNGFQYPWREFDEGTQSVQFSTNYELTLLEMPLIGEDGKLGPETCGANQYLVTTLGADAASGHVEFLELADCRSFEYPPTPGGAVVAAPPGNGVRPPVPIPVSTRAGMGTLGWLLIAAGVAAVGVYLATRKKG